MKNTRILPDEHRDDKTAPGLLLISHLRNDDALFKFVPYSSDIAPDVTKMDHFKVI